jgi:hypothetical protein
LPARQQVRFGTTKRGHIDGPERPGDALADHGAATQVLGPKATSSSTTVATS